MILHYHRLSVESGIHRPKHIIICIFTSIRREENKWSAYTLSNVIYSHIYLQLNYGNDSQTKKEEYNSISSSRSH